MSEPHNQLTETADIDAPECLDAALAIAFGPKLDDAEEVGFRSADRPPGLQLREPYPTAPRNPAAGTDSYLGLSDRYQIDGELARGGMGVILRGRDRDLGREVAIKVLREEHRNNAAMRRRF